MALNMDNTNSNQLLLIIIALGLVWYTVYGPSQQQQKSHHHQHHHEPSSMYDRDSPPRGRSGPREDPASHFASSTYQTVWMAVTVIVAAVAYCFWRQNEQSHRLHHAHTELRGEFREQTAGLRAELTERRAEGDRFQAHIVGQAAINNALNANLATVGERAALLREDIEHDRDRLERATQSQAQLNNRLIGDLAATRENVNGLQANVQYDRERFDRFQSAQIEYNREMDSQLRVANATLDAHGRELNVQREAIDDVRNRNNNGNLLLDLASVFAGPAVNAGIRLLGNAQAPPPPRGSRREQRDQRVPRAPRPLPGPQNLPPILGGGAGDHGIPDLTRKNRRR